METDILIVAGAQSVFEPTGPTSLQGNSVPAPVQTTSEVLVEDKDKDKDNF